VKLILGVYDVPYSDASYNPVRASKNPKYRRGRARRPTADVAASNHKTTGDVAVILEDEYHIMETFFELHEDMIGDMLCQSMSDTLDELADGAPGDLSLTAAATSKIEETFKRWLSERGMDATATAGVPTKAAMMGVSHRFLHPYAKRPSRPSFIDTGLYEASFVAWTEI
jgi:hypothetical protein